MGKADRREADRPIPSRGGGEGSYPTGQAPHKTGGECISPAGIDSYLFHSFIRGRGEGGGQLGL